MPERRSATLPAPRTRIIGREVEFAEIGRRLAMGSSRVLTLTGVAGIGKTTVAVGAARAAAEAGAEAAVFVDLTPTRDADEIALRCCDALGLLQGRPALTMLVEHLAPRELILVLDNCEHVVGPLRPLVDRLLDRCPDLRILATSRVPLRVRGEHVMAIPPMAVPDPGARTMTRLASNPAVELFVERASAADPSFTLDEDSARAVAAICRHVEGVPLAVELVASQAAALTPREIEARLSQRNVPGEPSTAAADRRMDATLDWSYELLTPAARGLFRRLAVFAGGWSVEAAEQVGGAGGDPSTMAGALVELVEHSLVVRGWRGDSSRYRLLTPVAEYAARRLDDPAERQAAARAHAEYYLGLISRPAATFPMSESEQLDLVAAEYDNCEAAMRVAEEGRLVPIVAEFALSLLTFWGVRGLLRTAIRRLESALALLGPEPGYGRAAVLGGLAAYHRLLGQHVVADECAVESERIFASVGDPMGHATAAGLRGEIAADLDDTAAAYAHYDRAWTALGDTADQTLRAVWHGNVGWIALRAGDLVRARRELDRALELLRGTVSWYHVQLLVRVGMLDRLEGRTDHAHEHLRAALGHARRYGARVDAAVGLEERARLALEEDEPARAATLLAAATGMRAATGLGMTAHDRRLLARDVERTRGALEPQAFDAAWRGGLDLSLDEVLAVAESRPGRPGPAVPSPRGSLLTARERQIARLVALGLTNKDVAHRLGIAPGTVRIHVERILGKLGLTSRVQVATWVVRNEGAVADA